MCLFMNALFAEEEDLFLADSIQVKHTMEAQ